MMANGREIQVSIEITRVKPEGCLSIATMVGELLEEIMNVTDVRTFNFNLEEARVRLSGFVENDKYYVFSARDNVAKTDVGFVTLYESYSLYAEGAFGTIPELYVRPQHRQQRIGEMLLRAAKEYAVQRGWKRLEVTTPPLPQFDRTLAFYEREGFGITGGRKLKMLL
jgi:GNAT superfamily N-acetyltransferase